MAIAVPDTTGGQKSQEGLFGLMSPLCSWIKFQRKVTTHATKVIQLFSSILWFTNQSHKSKVLRRKLCHCPVPTSTSPVFSFCCLLTDRNLDSSAPLQEERPPKQCVTRRHTDWHSPGLIMKMESSVTPTSLYTRRRMSEYIKANGGKTLHTYQWCHKTL